MDEGEVCGCFSLCTTRVTVCHAIGGVADVPLGGGRDGGTGLSGRPAEQGTAVVGSMLLGSFQSALLPQSLRNTDGFMAEMALLSLDAEPPRAGTELPARGMRSGGDTEVSFALSICLGAPFTDELTFTLPWCTPGSPFLTWERLLLPQKELRTSLTRAKQQYIY